MKTRYALLVVVAVLVLAALACGSDNTGEKVDTEKESAPPTNTPGVETHRVGDAIAVKDHTIALNEAEIQGSTLRANFTVENKGSDDLVVSSLMSFEAKADDGTKLEQEIFDCSPGLDGTVLPGDKLKGWICWSGASTSQVKIYYRASLLGSGAIVWEVSK